jgi:hypothetical protein
MCPPCKWVGQQRAQPLQRWTLAFSQMVGGVDLAQIFLIETWSTASALLGGGQKEDAVVEYPHDKKARGRQAYGNNHRALSALRE